MPGCNTPAVTTDTSGTPEAPGRRRWRDILAVPLMIVLGSIAIAVAAWSVGAFALEDAPGPLVPRADPLLPDLAMGPIEDIAVGTTSSGQQRLRFAAQIVNIGEGPFIVRAQRPWIGGQDWTVEQWIEERSGGYSSSTTNASLVYGGDGHDHWHAKQVEVHQLETLDGKVLGRLVKQGFCFFDTDPYKTELAGSPDHSVWGGSGCATPYDTRVRMGLSVGWGDLYPWYLIDERIDVTEVPDGTYRLREIADPNNDFEETNESNNETWVDIQLMTSSAGRRDLKVVQTGPAP
jgi:Lysyl oxidase